jgi:deazaflavin-dependent oxidoreductase (nitroreductase family)
MAVRRSAPRQVTLTTTGRRTGLTRTATLYAFEDGDDLVIVGSRGGAARDPAWAHNLRANPEAAVRRGRDVIRVHAREVGAKDRERLWKLVTKSFPLYAAYQRRTKRTIPLFVLEPIAREP